MEIEEADSRVVESLAADAPRKVKHRLLRVPFAHRYRDDHFYERQCYDKYYTLIDGLLQKGEECVTVTGTPGIGKSLFYAYFAERYLEDHAGDWVIAVAATSTVLPKVTIFGEEECPLYPDVEDSVVQAVRKAAGRAMKQGKRLLQLCDGPPAFDQLCGQTVVFTSPDEKWLRFVEKIGRTYYMPLWTREELHEAARVLRLSPSEAEIDERFRIFGGTARYCLNEDPELVADAIERICKEIAVISDLRQLQQLILGSVASQTRHRMLHLEPSESSMALKATGFASPFVEERLAAHILTFDCLERHRISEWLGTVPMAAALRARILEGITCDALSRHHHRLQTESVMDATSTSSGSKTVAIDGISDTPPTRGLHHKSLLKA